MEYTEYKLKSGNLLRVYQDENPESPREWDNLGTMVCGHRRYTLGDVQVKSQREGLLHVANAVGVSEYKIYDDEEIERTNEELNELLVGHPDIVVLPIYMYEHSGITINTTGFSCRWDSGQLGFIYVTLEKLRKELNSYNKESIDLTDAELIERGREILEQEVKTYDQYLIGDVYRFRLIKLIDKPREVTNLILEQFDKTRYLTKQARAFAETMILDILKKNITNIKEEIIDSCGGFYGSDPKENGIMDSIDEELIDNE